MSHLRHVAVIALIAIGLAGCILLFGTRSYALATPPAEGWGAADLRVAAEYWGTSQPANCATEQIHWEAPPAWHGERGAAATIATAPGTACEMWIGPYEEPYEQCLVIVHEFGHWQGYGWGTDPHSVTYDGSNPGSADSGLPWEPPVIGRCLRLEGKHS